MNQNDFSTQQPNFQPQQQNQQQPQYVQVDVRFLQVVLNYLQTRPYGEVWQMIDVLTGRSQFSQQQTQQPANIEEYRPQ